MLIFSFTSLLLFLLFLSLHFVFVSFINCRFALTIHSCSLTHSLVMSNGCLLISIPHPHFISELFFERCLVCYGCLSIILFVMFYDLEVNLLAEISRNEDFYLKLCDISSLLFKILVEFLVWT